MYFEPAIPSISNMCLNRGSHADPETGCLAAGGLQWGPVRFSRSPFPPRLPPQRGQTCRRAGPCPPGLPILPELNYLSEGHLTFSGDRQNGAGAASASDLLMSGTSITPGSESCTEPLYLVHCAK